MGESAKLEKYFSWAAKTLLFGTVLTPLIVTPSLFLFPFVFGKVIFFRVLVELALVFGVVVLVLRFCRSDSDESSRSGSETLQGRMTDSKR